MTIVPDRLRRVLSGECRLALLLFALTAVAILAGPAKAQSQGIIEVTDVAGRTVRVKAPVERVILGEGRQMYVVGLLDKEDPFRRVVGWRDDLAKADPNTFRQY